MDANAQKLIDELNNYQVTYVNNGQIGDLGDVSNAFDAVVNTNQTSGGLYYAREYITAATNGKGQQRMITRATDAFNSGASAAPSYTGKKPNARPNGR
jgi:hypothetical protein